MSTSPVWLPRSSMTTDRERSWLWVSPRAPTDKELPRLRRARPVFDHLTAPQSMGLYATRLAHNSRLYYPIASVRVSQFREGPVPDTPSKTSPILVPPSCSSASRRRSRYNSSPVLGLLQRRRIGRLARSSLFAGGARAAKRLTPVRPLICPSVGELIKSCGTCRVSSIGYIQQRSRDKQFATRTGQYSVSINNTACSQQSLLS